MALTDELQRLGLALPGPRRPTVALSGSAEEIVASYAAVDAALRQRPGYRLAIAARPADLGALRARYPHELVVPEPYPTSAASWRRALGVVLSVAPRRLAGLHPGQDVLDPGGKSLGEELAQKLPRLGSPARHAAAGAWLADRFGGSRIVSPAALKSRLGNPGTIVCLGNGPSSQDRRLAGFHDAALFRVNWTWRGAGRLATPDVVFTADPDLPPAGRRPILVFPTAAAGQPILLRHLLRLRRASAGHVFLDAFDPPPADLSGFIIPTNGALMIAIAAALQPARLVIAGMDLYRHPQGRYPGDPHAIDGYSREHSMDMDLAVIGRALDGFGGEIVNFSDNLRAALGGQP